MAAPKEETTKMSARLHRRARTRRPLLIVANDCKLLRNGLMEIARFNGRRVDISASNSVINVINVEIATSLSRRWIRGNVTVGFG